METKAHKEIMNIEHHCLVTRYSHLRIRKPDAVEKLTTSIEQYGQLTPVAVVPEANNRWVLIDGYLRMKALKRLGKDTIEAEEWSCSVSEALIMVIKNQAARALEIFEEALLLYELYKEFGLSQNILAERLGRDQSWVSRRLSLLEFLPDSVLPALIGGKISLWVATRVLTPMARAITLHAEQLLKYLLKNVHNTREIKSFYEHYQKSNATERKKMVNEPGLFFKAQRLLSLEKQGIDVKNGGPEGRWQHGCRNIGTQLAALITLAPSIFYERQTLEECNRLLSEYDRTKTKFDELTRTIKELQDARKRSKAYYYATASERENQACNQQIA